MNNLHKSELYQKVFTNRNLITDFFKYIVLRGRRHFSAAALLRPSAFQQRPFVCRPLLSATERQPTTGGTEFVDLIDVLFSLFLERVGLFFAFFFETIYKLVNYRTPFIISSRQQWRLGWPGSRMARPEPTFETLALQPVLLPSGLRFSGSSK